MLTFTIIGFEFRMPMGRVSGYVESALRDCGACALTVKIKRFNFIQLEEDIEKKG